MEHPGAASQVVDRLPQLVRARLDQGPRSVLVDTQQLLAVRARFDAEQSESLARYLEASQSPNTLRAYRSDWLAWSAWCAAEGRQALPADPLDVAVYLAAAADTRKPTGAPAFSPATLERKSAAIAAVHAANGLPSPTRSDVVRLTLRGIRRTRRTQPTRKRPVLLHTLEELLAGLPNPGWPTEPARRRDQLLLLVGFAGALRRSELAALTLDDVTVDTDLTTGEPLLLVHLASTKTDPTGIHEQRVALPRGQRPHTCPVCAFANWVALLEVNAANGSTALQHHLTPQSPTAAQPAAPQTSTATQPAAPQTSAAAQSAAPQPPTAAQPAGPQSSAASRSPSTTVHTCHAYQGTHLANGSAHPLFPAITKHGHLGTTPISGRAVAELVKRYAARAGLDPALFSGHSLRAGFATQAALGGASDREIMRQGRWSNPRTVHRYIRTANPLEDNAVTKLGL
ncbi:site-specific integrase [Crossiella cryophila]|uniref:Integrase n=1 Tax=Crossiella cryophila TaxID=43355 RepID=A0A7W7CDT8_9PSEU|nr:site-specific integrase [Crossiella cryophila]MBB4679345.1 integrase [Crossiella cryophila]